ncbi:Zn-ribbon domain-containing OB-fold protein [Dactylosporangium fulvum]|uniref:OB-fold domain-containing protein n=1 Tax=Dactylosporangium fulvum TaxID=53359 RepID=A0ABY5WBS5_9ACTN|nr:OB-fold domain-containing protein [Dactylosporangium fulvum]UWP86790.1 OB-fold domain-containing protein [Dactylosporangium fulvum]
MVEADFSATGTVYASTLIHVSAPNLPNPYHVGYVDLPEGVRIFGHFATADPVPPDCRVRVVAHERPDDQTGPFVRFRFFLDGPSNGRRNENG